MTKDQIVSRMENIVRLAETEDRGFTEGEKLEFDSLKSQAENLITEKSKMPVESPAGNLKKVPVPAVHTTDHNYDISKVFQAGLEGRQLDGLEGERHQEIIGGMSAERRKQAQGTYRIPLDVLSKSMGTVAPNDQLAATTGEDLKTGLYSPVGDGILPDMALRQTKVQFITSNAELVEIPVMDAPLSAGWTARDADLHVSSDANMSTVDMTPRILGTVFDLERSSVYSPFARQAVLNVVRTTVESALDEAILTGGVANGPQMGILTDASVGTNVTTAGSLVTEFEANRIALLEYMKKDQSVPMEAVLNATAAAWLRVQPAWADAQVPAMSGNVIGNTGIYDSIFMPLTDATPDTGTCVMGSFEEVICCIWDSVGVSQNPFGESQWNRGAVSVRLFLEADTIIRDVNKLRKFEVVASA